MGDVKEAELPIMVGAVFISRSGHRRGQKPHVLVHKYCSRGL